MSSEKTHSPQPSGSRFSGDSRSPTLFFINEYRGEGPGFGSATWTCRVPTNNLDRWCPLSKNMMRWSSPRKNISRILKPPRFSSCWHRSVFHQESPIERQRNRGTSGTSWHSYGLAAGGPNFSLDRWKDPRGVIEAFKMLKRKSRQRSSFWVISLTMIRKALRSIIIAGMQ